jgi:hypothetical protein
MMMQSDSTLQADILDAWDQATMELLTKRCIKPSVACGGCERQQMPGFLT